jgi:3-oxoacyl-[acyl-carrier protein] reductase
MNLDLTDRVVLVSGSSRGIGRAIAYAFLSEGARVVVTGRRAEPLEQTATVLADEFGAARVQAHCGDLTDPEHIAATLAQVGERWGQIECLVANVGSGTAKPGWQLGQAEWDAVFATNFWSSVKLVEAVLPGMLQQRRGSVVLIGSIVGSESLSAPVSYSAAKAALVSYSKNVARQLGPQGVRINCVAPGNILFPGGSWERKLNERREFFQRYIESEVPLQRFGTPEEIADLVVFLSSNRAAFITGSYIVADGGQTRGY